MTLAASLRSLLASKPLLQAMAAHSPLSGRIAEEAGFDAIWASGFELSALYGLPDLSLLSLSQHLDMTRAICAQVSIPVIADIDTGYGNAVNVSYVVREYERAGAAAVVIEDKVFPKVTSLLPGGRQDLVRVAEFEGKVAAAVSARASDDFLIIARTEALIADLGEGEALARAQAYEAAGADMILVHSKSRSPAQIESFARAWHGKTRLVIVPTTYPEMDTRRIHALGGKIGMVIYGNHAVRAAVAAMQATFAMILRDGGTQAADATIATIEEIFRLQHHKQARDLESKFLR